MGCSHWLKVIQVTLFIFDWLRITALLIKATEDYLLPAWYMKYGNLQVDNNTMAKIGVAVFAFVTYTKYQTTCWLIKPGIWLAYCIRMHSIDSIHVGKMSSCLQAKPGSDKIYLMPFVINGWISTKYAISLSWNHKNCKYIWFCPKQFCTFKVNPSHPGLREWWYRKWCFQEHAYTYTYTYAYTYTYTYLLLISMLWQRQATFESKGDKLSSSDECRISKLGSLRHQIASRLNAHSQTDWAIEEQAKNLELNSPSLWWVSI